MKQSKFIKNDSLNNSDNSLDWISNNPKIKEQVSKHLAENLEIPQMVFGYSPVAAEEASNFINTKMLPSGSNSIVYKEKGLLSREVSFVRQRLDRVSKVNLFDVAETSGDSSLPFIYELLEFEMLSSYSPVTPNNQVNEIAISKVKNFIKQSLLGSIDYHSILADTELETIENQVVDISKKMESDDFLNLFLLTGSRLGNSSDPQKMLSNIYKSMTQNDCLAIIQGLYRSGSESSILADYENIVAQDGNLMVQKLIANKLNPGGQHKIYWEDSVNPGIRFGTKVEDKNSEFGVEVGKTVNLFRSNRFKEGNLRDMLLNVGFTIIDIAYDKNMDHGMFFLEK